MKLNREHTIIGRRLRLLGRAIQRVPSGRRFNAETQEGKTWDANTGLFLRRRGEGGSGGGTMTVHEASAVLAAAEGEMR